MSLHIARRCVASGMEFGIDVELYPAVYYGKMHEVHLRYSLVLKYKPVRGWLTDFDAKTAPRTRIANGTTHYLLYKWAVENNLAVHILEHDAYFVGQPPKSIYNGVIQTSSHATRQMTPEVLRHCRRAQRRRKHEPDWKYDATWGDQKGVIPHPLNATNGTSGYIIGPGAAAKMVDYIETDGIANADRIRAEHIGEGNVYLQVPQSVLCDHCIKSHVL